MTQAWQPLPAEERGLVLDALGHAVVATDTEGRVTYWNRAAETLFGWTPEQALGSRITDLAVPEFSSDRGEEILASLLAGETWRGPFTVRRRDGTTFTAMVTAGTLRDGSGTALGVTAVVTSLGQTLRLLLSQSHEVSVVTGVDGVVHFASPAVERVLGWTDHDLAGRSLLDLVHEQDKPRVEQWLRSSTADPSTAATVEFRTRSAAGSWTWVEGLLANLLDEPTVRGLVWTLRDTSDRRLALERMTEAALHDPLTGLPNRLLLRDRIAQATARRDPHGALLFIDLDGFKQVNDDLGHEAGDTLLKTVAQRLVRTVREEDSCGRWAGDEFIVLNESLQTTQEAVALAERVGRALAAPVEIAGQTISTRASIGVAMLDDSHDPERVIRLADEGMYRVKQQHRRDGTGGSPGPEEPAGAP
jgi:diguanylate cyclase (GGDEF)-like protein/PAS domain S-box-containing protein